MPEYKLTYFAIRGRAEPIRLLLTYLGEDFENHTFKKEEWAKIKPTTPLGKVPVLEVDGKPLVQTNAICRWLGRKAGLAGSDDWEALQIDIAVDTIVDLLLVVAGYFYEPDEKKKAEKKEKAHKEEVPTYLGKLDQQVKENNGYLANGKLSWGDLFFFGLSDALNFYIGYNVFEKHPNLKELRENVLAVPSIKKWVDNRPEAVM